MERNGSELLALALEYMHGCTLSIIEFIHIVLFIRKHFFQKASPTTLQNGYIHVYAWVCSYKHYVCNATFSSNWVWSSLLLRNELHRKCNDISSALYSGIVFPSYPANDTRWIKARNAYMDGNFYFIRRQYAYLEVDPPVANVLYAMQDAIEYLNRWRFIYETNDKWSPLFYWCVFSKSKSWLLRQPLRSEWIATMINFKQVWLSSMSPSLIFVITCPSQRMWMPQTINLDLLYPFSLYAKPHSSGIFALTKSIWTILRELCTKYYYPPSLQSFLTSTAPHVHCHAHINRL